MPYIRVWIHAVWATKERKPFLTSEIRQSVFDHISENARLKEIFIDCISGHQDHIHCVISLSNEQSISKVIQLIKGESSFWINKNNLCKQKFEWQDEYFAVSVSESQLDALRNYIANQEEHHKKKSFAEEYDEFIRKYNFDDLG